MSHRYKQDSYIYSENLYYSRMRRQWLLAYDSNGTIEGLIPRDWYSSKLDALMALKKALEFREGLVANATPIQRRIQTVNTEIFKLRNKLKAKV